MACKASGNYKPFESLVSTIDTIPCPLSPTYTLLCQCLTTYFSYKSCTTFHTFGIDVLLHTPADILWAFEAGLWFCRYFFILHMSNHSINHPSKAFLSLYWSFLFGALGLAQHLLIRYMRRRKAILPNYTTRTRCVARVPFPS